MLVFDSTVTVGEQKLVDQGGDALTAGVRLGYGHRFANGFYLSIEGEAFGASGRSRAVVNGQQYSYQPNAGGGAFVRAGWQMQSGALFYARVGAQVFYTNTRTEVAPAIGAGAEVIMSGPWFARIDLTYANSSIETYQGTVGVGRRW
jgi:hypothetical protein